MQLFKADISKHTIAEISDGIMDVCNTPVVYATQADIGRKFGVYIEDLGQEYQFYDGDVLSVWYSGTSGDGNYTSIDDSAAVTVEDNLVCVELISQMVSLPGGGVICLVLNDAYGRQIGLWKLSYLVESLPGYDSAEAKQYFTAFSEAVDYLREAASVIGTDKTLTVSGQAADAAVVGALLNGKLSVKESDAYPGCFYMETDEGSVWLNPPMIENQEYRIMEHWRGNPVYTKLINFGSLPASNMKSVPFSYAHDKLVELRGIVWKNNYFSELPLGANGEFGAYGYVGDGILAVRVNINMTEYNAFFVVKYIK